MGNAPLVQEIEKNLIIRDGHGVAAEIGLTATMYFRGISDPAKRQAVATCIAMYREIAGENLRQAAHPKTGKFHPLTKGVPSPEEWLRDLPADKEWAFQYRGGDDADIPSTFSVEAFGAQEYGKSKLGYFKVAFPMLFFANRQDSFIEHVLSFCRLIQPEQGYGGLGILESPFSRIQELHEPTVYQLAQRFPGLDADYPVTHGLWLNQENRIKGVNWLTILGDRWVKQIGGVANLKSQLTEEFMFREYDGGVLIKAGSRPQMGDMEKGSVPADYVRLNEVLKPIRIVKHRMFQHPGADRFDQANSEAWLARFDRFTVGQ